MRHALARLLVLAWSFGLMALAPPSLELARLPPGQADAGAPPTLPDWRARARAPGPARPLAAPQVALLPAAALPEFGHFSERAFLDEMARRQGLAAAEALVLLRGSITLEELTRAVADPAILTRDRQVFTLHRPLVVRQGAALTVAGKVLRLATASGAFLVNGGQLVVHGAQITSWDAERGGPSELEHDRDFRPFVAGIGGSWTEIADSTLRALGYFAAKSYGLSLVAGPATLPAAGAPRGRITGSRITGNYYGLYSYEADDVVIAGNLFADNIVYGIDPHDRSQRLLIAGNTAIGTRRKHGIVISQGVSDSWIIENRAVGNAGTGIVLDAGSTDNVVAGNLAMGNRGDGLSLFESGRNLLWGNLALANHKSGLRIRNGWAIEAHRNVFADNGYDGVEAYAEELPPDLAGRYRSPAELRLGLSLGHNRFIDNARTAINVRRPGRIELFGLHRAADAPPLRLGGDLEAHAAAIESRLERSGGLRITGNAEADGSAAPD